MPRRDYDYVRPLEIRSPFRSADGAGRFGPRVLQALHGTGHHPHGTGVAQPVATTMETTFSSDYSGGTTA